MSDFLNILLCRKIKHSLLNELKDGLRFFREIGKILLFLLVLSVVVNTTNNFGTPRKRIIANSCRKKQHFMLRGVVLEALQIGITGFYFLIYCCSEGQ